MTDLVELKSDLHAALRDIAGGGTHGLAGRLDAIYGPDARWRGSHPLNAAEGTAGMVESLWAPLMHAMPDLERRDVIFVAGRSIHDKALTGDARGVRVAAVGHLCGTFSRSWCGIPPTGRALYLRYGEVHEIGADGRIARTTLLIDVLDAMRQAGWWPIAPSLGAEEMWPAPFTADGVRLGGVDEERGEASIRQTLAMHRSLAEFDDASEENLGRRDRLIAMPQREHWHPKMMWYGPAGIGTTRGLEGFVDHHQLPFRIAFPNRRGGATLNETGDREGGHYVQIGDGPYSVTGGWPSVRAEHLGPDWLGMPPTGRPIGMRVMDFYLHDEGLIRENWVPIDILDILMQMGFDALGRMRHLIEHG